MPKPPASTTDVSNANDKAAKAQTQLAQSAADLDALDATMS